MKRAPAILLVLLFALLAFKDVLLVFNFHINRDEIAREFCINLDRPEIMCYGMCHLVDTFEAEQDKEQENPALDPGDKQLNYIGPTTAYVALLGADEDSRSIVPFREHYARIAVGDIFRPPRQFV